MVPRYAVAVVPSPCSAVTVKENGDPAVTEAGALTLK
jgi:hypothetical protein